MHFVLAFPLISLLLIFDVVSSQTCQNANWWSSLDRIGWSVCPKSNTYLKGLWRNDFRSGDERTGRIEMGKCCQASVGSKPLEEPSSCSNADWSAVLKGKNVWALCPAGYYMNGLRLGKGPPQFLNDIVEGKCCHPESHSRATYEDCYDENVQLSFDKKGWSECKKEGYYMTGFYKSSCNSIYCIETFRCCKMKIASSECKKANWWSSLDRQGWSQCPQTNTFLKGLWRNDFKAGDERVGRIEEGTCCTADEPCYADEPANCKNVDWTRLLDGFNVWALCPAGYYMNSLRLGKGPPQFLRDIDEAKCWHPDSHPDSYDSCYDEDVTHSFDKKGLSSCKREGYYMAGFYKSSCNNIYCIEKFRCCKMSVVRPAECKKANWWNSLDRQGWSVCPQTNTYLKGLWRNDFKAGDERVGRIEEGTCCFADEPCYTDEPANCKSVDWTRLLDGFNVWALCPAGYYMNSLRLGKGPPQFLRDIDEAKCCHPEGHPESYDSCYDEDVSRSFDKKGLSSCKREGYYMAGFYKSSCNNIYCIEKFRCCKMSVDIPAECKKANWWSSLDRIGWSECPQTNTYLKGLWRNDFKAGDERVGRIEEGTCCAADEPCYANKPARCKNADWTRLLDGFNVWALCPAGYYMNSLRLGKGPPQFLRDMDEAKCCHPEGHPESYDSCYDEDVSRSFDKKGLSSCKREGYYMAGFFKSSCNNIYCIEKFRCCKMKRALK
ncbi:uncharacterized protein LOC111340494 [Stylophora pistillata]|nr:uncharacterized protein LOC111340494 [Stylophora pistillata]